MIRLLVEVEPEDGNVNVVEKYGNRRFMYDTAGQRDIKMIAVPLRMLKRQAMIVHDPWVTSKTFGIGTSFDEVPDTPDSRRFHAFFEVAGYDFTSICEKFD